MIFTPLFRVGDVVTMRSDLCFNDSIHMLGGAENLVGDAVTLRVLGCDIEQAGNRGVVTRAYLADGTSCPQCGFEPPNEYPEFDFVDETMVEAYRIMRFLNYLDTP